MEQFKLTTLILVTLIIISILCYAFYQDGFKKGQEDYYKKVFSDLSTNGFYNFPYAVNETNIQLIKLVPYVEEKK